MDDYLSWMGVAILGLWSLFNIGVTIWLWIVAQQLKQQRRQLLLWLRFQRLNQTNNQERL